MMGAAGLGILLGNIPDEYQQHRQHEMQKQAIHAPMDITPQHKPFQIQMNTRGEAARRVQCSRGIMSACDGIMSRKLPEATPPTRR